MGYKHAIQLSFRRFGFDIAYFDRIRLLKHFGINLVFDVGANVGEYSALILDTLGPHTTVHAFEPSADAYSVLSSRLLGRSGVHLHPFGLGFEEAEVPLYTNQPASTWASVLPRRAEYTGVTFMPAGTVRLRRLDVVCRELNLCHIDLLKVDVEGYDLAVLQGAGELLESGAIKIGRASCRERV